MVKENKTSRKRPKNFPNSCSIWPMEIWENIISCALILFSLIWSNPTDIRCFFFAVCLSVSCQESLITKEASWGQIRHQTCSLSGPYRVQLNPYHLRGWSSWCRAFANHLPHFYSLISFIPTKIYLPLRLYNLSVVALFLLVRESLVIVLFQPLVAIFLRLFTTFTSEEVEKATRADSCHTPAPPEGSQTNTEEAKTWFSKTEKVFSDHWKPTIYSPEWLICLLRPWNAQTR